MAESVDQQLSLASVYANSLFDLARNAGQVEAVRDELAELVRLGDMEPGFDRLMQSQSVSADARAASLEKMFRGKLSDLTLNTLLVMNGKDRAGLYRALHQAFIERARAAANEVLAVAISAIELDNAQQQEIERTAAELSGKKPVMEYRVDNDLIGGLVLEIGDVRYDYSVRRQLQRQAAGLSERGQRGLKVTVEEPVA